MKTIKITDKRIDWSKEAIPGLQSLKESVMDDIVKFALYSSEKISKKDIKKVKKRLSLLDS